MLTSGHKTAAFFLLQYVVLIGHTTRVYADDEAAPIVSGSLVLPADSRIVLDTEEVTIAPDLIDVSSRFTNVTDQDVVLEISFPFPEAKGFREDSYVPPLFQDFRIESDGRPVRYRRKILFFVDGRDVTDIASSAGIPISDKYLIAAEPHVRFDIAEGKQKALVAQNILKADGEPNWSTRTTLSWTQVFPKMKSVKLRHRYKPYLGFGYPDTSKPREDFARLTCGDVSAIWNWDDVNKESPVHPFWISYALHPANTQPRKIASFHLVVKQPRGSNVSFCWDGPRPQKRSDAWELTAKDFIPSRDLNVYYLVDLSEGAADIKAEDSHFPRSERILQMVNNWLIHPR